jgi:penicillin amidase
MKWLMLVGAALVLAACGSSSGKADGGGASSTGTSTSGSGSGSGSSSGSSGSSGSVDAGPYAIPGLAAPVTVTSDAHEIPHIHCATMADCYRVQGYVHAHDRMFEMEFYRHVAEGRLEEMTGKIASTPQIDHFFRTVFLTRDGQRIEEALTANLDASTRALLQAYADGVNAYLDEARAGIVPLNGEFTALGLTAADVSAWRIQDTLAVGRLQQWSLSETFEEEVNYAVMYSRMNQNELAALIHPRMIDPAYTVPGLPLTRPVAPRGGGALTAPRPELQALGTLSRDLAAVTEAVGIGKHGFTGSNNWVVDAAHSATGAAMVANDPHLSLDFPPLFHLAHLTADAEGIDLIGATFPAIPGALSGRGAHVGWGVTVVGYDVTDLYVESFTDATHVSFNGQPVAVVQYPQTLTIRNRTGAPTTETFNVSMVPHHGPIVAMLPGNHALSLRWTGHEVTNEVKALQGLQKAASVDEAFTALKDWGTGAQNFVLADDQGHIGYDPHALVPARPWAGRDSPLQPDGGSVRLLPWLPLPGDGSAEWGFDDGGLWLPDSELPQAKDPAQGFLATANSDPVGVTDDDIPVNDKNYLSFGFDDQSGLRIRRITDRLSALTADGGLIAQADMEALQSDHAVILGRYVVPIVQALQTTRAADVTAANLDPEVTLLAGWAQGGYQCPTGQLSLTPGAAVDPDPTVNRDSSACTYFHALVRTLYFDLFNDDNAFYWPNGEAQIDPQLGLKAIILLNDPTFPAMFKTLCDDRTTTTVVESCSDITLKAMQESRDLLERRFSAPTSSWIWGAVHTVSFNDPLAPFPGFTTTNYARPGGAFSIDVATPSTFSINPTATSSANFHYAHGPNERFVGLMNGAATRWQLPGFEVDRPATDPPTGLLKDWLTNTYFDFARTPAEVTAAGVSTVTFHAR